MKRRAFADPFDVKRIESVAVSATGIEHLAEIHVGRGAERDTLLKPTSRCRPSRGRRRRSRRLRDQRELAGRAGVRATCIHAGAWGDLLCAARPAVRTEDAHAAAPCGAQQSLPAGRAFFARLANPLGRTPLLSCRPRPRLDDLRPRVSGVATRKLAGRGSFVSRG